MRNLISIISLLILTTNTTFAKEKIEKPKTWQEARTFFWKYINKANDNQVIIIPRGTLNCRDEDSLKKGVKILIRTNSPLTVKRYGCNYTDTTSRGLITDNKNGSNIVRIAYQVGDYEKEFSSHSSNVGHRYFYWPNVHTLADEKKWEIK